jgi:glycosyltransferase involved in cell wall biosynthesis
MKVLMFTNTFLPHVGGVAKSVSGMSQALRSLGHQVKVVAPTYANLPPREIDVIRTPAFTNFNRSGFSVPLPAPGRTFSALRKFRPDVIHSHHCFLLGNAALKCAAWLDVPLVYTYHTLYEHYMHYFGGDSPRLRRFVVHLAANYCALCDTVIAPSTSLANLLRHRNVKCDVKVVPTGVEPAISGAGNGAGVRKRAGIPADALVIGHVGRLAPEKNLEFLSLALCAVLRRFPEAHVLIAGVGPMEVTFQRHFSELGLSERLHVLGVLSRAVLFDVYRAMDIFAFSSRSETQGLVITEAMAAGLPVVALNGPGVRDVIIDRVNGRLVSESDIPSFVRAIEWLATLGDEQRASMAKAIACTVDEFSLTTSAKKLLGIYRNLIQTRLEPRSKLRGPAWAMAKQGQIAANYLASIRQASQRPKAGCPDGGLGTIMHQGRSARMRGKPRL